jgi:hypothetical protein
MCVTCTLTSFAEFGHGQTVWSWPLLVRALPGRGGSLVRMGGTRPADRLGQVHPLPGSGIPCSWTARSPCQSVFRFTPPTPRAGGCLPAMQYLPVPAGSPTGPRWDRCCWAWPGRSPRHPARAAHARAVSPPQCPACRFWSWNWVPRGRHSSPSPRCHRARSEIRSRPCGGVSERVCGAGRGRPAGAVAPAAASCGQFSSGTCLVTSSSAPALTRSRTTSGSPRSTRRRTGTPARMGIPAG